MQAQAADDTRMLKSQCQDLDEKLEKERRRVQALQMELVARTHEATAAREQHERAAREADSQIQQREAELTLLRTAAASAKPAAVAAAAAQTDQKYENTQILTHFTTRTYNMNVRRARSTRTYSSERRSQRCRC